MFHNDKNITVIGCGRWGSFLAWYLSDCGFNVTMYGRNGSSSYNNLKNTRKNEYITLPDNVNFTSDLHNALTISKTVVISVGTQSYPDLLSEIVSKNIDTDSLNFILCMKGIVENGGKRLSEVTKEILGYNTTFALWVGPGHPEDFIRGIPNCMLIVSENEDFAKHLCSRFASSLIRFYYSTDMVGCEIGAATKNVIGIAAGMLDGKNYSSLKGALMARGPREIARLVSAMGGDERSIFGLSHIGDYEATLFSEHSHNRQFGEKFVRGEKYDKLAEGVYTVCSVMQLKERYNVEMPICTAVHDVIYLGKNPDYVMNLLFHREQKKEF